MLVIKQQVCVVIEVKQLFSNLIQQLGFDFYLIAQDKHAAQSQVIGCYGTC